MTTRRESKRRRLWPNLHGHAFAESTHGHPAKGMVGLLFLFLFVTSGAILYTTTQNMHVVEDLAVQSLQSTAFALASSVEQTIRQAGKKSVEMKDVRDIFSDRVVAYALLSKEDGTVSFHTNPRLIGTSLPRNDIEQTLKKGVASGRRITLHTGTPAYEFDSLLHNADGSAEILRLVLHTTPADQIVARTRRSWWPVAAVLSLLWVTGILLWRIMVRHGRLQEEFEKRRQMAIVGQMTAVLAHEIRNALASIKGYAQLVDEKTPGSDVRKAGLAAVLQGTGRIENLVHDLLLYSRKEEYHITTVDASRLLGDTARLSLPSWNGTVEITGEPQVPVRADREKLHRVIDNGLRNAIQSMGNQGGTLTLSARNEGRWGVIRIEDTGAGIGEKELPRLFTPFYTTKTEGVGLGLSYSEKVVRGMGGKIYLSNRSGVTGAVLTIQLSGDREANG